jgi:hypothetical protein
MAATLTAATVVMATVVMATGMVVTATAGTVIVLATAATARPVKAVLAMPLMAMTRRTDHPLTIKSMARAGDPSGR